MDFYWLFRLLSGSFGFFLILSEFSRICLYPLEIVRILPDAFQSSWNFVEFSHILSYSFRFCLIFSYSLRSFKIISYPLGIWPDYLFSLWLFQIFPDSLTFSWILIYSSGFYHFFRKLSELDSVLILNHSIGNMVAGQINGFSRILLGFLVCPRILHIFLDSLGFFWIIMDSSGISQFLSVSFEFLPILSYPVGIWQYSRILIFSVISYSFGFSRIIFEFSKMLKYGN